MTTTVILERKICIDSEYIDKNIRNNILLKIKEITNNECSKSEGYFLNIIKIICIKDNYISPNCENIFIVEFEAETLKPDIGTNTYIYEKNSESMYDFSRRSIFKYKK